MKICTFGVDFEGVEIFYAFAQLLWFETRVDEETEEDIFLFWEVLLEFYG